MKLTRYLVPTLLSCVAMIGCGSRQPAQPVAQQPLVGDQPAPVQQAAMPADAPPAPQYERVPNVTSAPPANRGVPPANHESAPPAISIPAGTPIDVRLQETIDTKRNRAGDAFAATLTHAILVDQQTVIPRGTRFTGHLIESKPSGRLKGHAELSLDLDSFELNGRRYEIKTTHVARASAGHKKRNWTLMGGGSGLGTALGAIAGGPAGALIGAGAGAGAGTVGAVFTGKKNVHLPVETPLAFALRAPVALVN